MKANKKKIADDWPNRDYYLAEWLKAGRKGDPDSARALLREFIAIYDAPRRRHVNPVWPAPILDYLVTGFDDYLRGRKSLEDALLLKNPRGKRERTPAIDALPIAAQLHLMITVAKKQPAVAMDFLCHKYGVSKRNLERYARTYKPMFASEQDDGPYSSLRCWAAMPVRPAK